jgi:transglutaminase superfamily protein/transglutaminase TgpA-like protein
MSLIGASRLPRAVAFALAAIASTLALALGAIALGLPARLVLPWHWGELAANLDYGLGGLWSIDYPYTGSTGWTRLVLLLGLPAVLVGAAALAFWPVRGSGRGLRAGGLVVLLVAYGVAATVAPPANPLLDGLLLLLFVWAWLWLPGQGLRLGLLGACLVLIAGLLALPLAAAFEGGRPWVDYRHWGASHAAGPTEAFSWDQAYGPLTWPRVGRHMLDVRSDTPYYWRAAVLDEFNGLSWVQSNSAGTGVLQLPARTPRNSDGRRLNPDWIHDVTYTVDRLRSELVVAAGTPLAPPRLDGLTVMERGMLLPSADTLEQGDTYTVRSYVPDPTPRQMRRAPRAYPATVTRDTQVALPGGRSLTVPFWGSEPGAAARMLSSSAYGGVYDLARRVTAGHSTTYGAVKAIENYLGAHYRYSEFAPIKRLALRTFLLRDRRGYCQHFSGAMALMLRMLGVPARVAAGFSPGRPEADGNYVVTDFDSHAWVEVYFNGIGWVTFDPTPAAAPAHSRTSGLGAPTAAPASQRGDLGNRRRKTNGSTGSGPGQGPAAGDSPSLTGAAWPWAALAAGLLAVGTAVVLRRRPSPHASGPEALLDEVAAAVARVRSWKVRGSTLLALQRRLEAEVGPGSAAYLARLRAMRYEPGEHAPPAARERSRLRRELASGLGLRRRLRALAAIPPWGPARQACKPPFRGGS